MGNSHPKCNALWLFCRNTRASGTIWDATKAEMAAAAGTGLFKYKFRGDESRIEVKENDGSLNHSSADKESVPADRKWWVVEIRIDEKIPEYPCILVYCELSQAFGAVFDYTDTEFAKAKGALLATYRWDDNLRVQVIVETSDDNASLPTLHQQPSATSQD